MPEYVSAGRRRRFWHRDGPRLDPLSLAGSPGPGLADGVLMAESAGRVPLIVGLAEHDLGPAFVEHELRDPRPAARALTIA